jgi:PAS domain S-box-containing protein
VVEREIRERTGRREHREARDALRLSEARFERLAESGIVGISIGDINGGILQANDAFLEQIGYTFEEIRSKDIRWTDLTPPDWSGADDTALEALRTTGIARPFEKELLRKDGTRIPLLIGLAVLDYPMTIVVTVDLTARKRAEEALRQTREQLLHAQKMEAVGSLAGGIAHDFNNILSVILSYAEMLQMDIEPGSPMLADIEEIRKAGKRAAELTRNLLAFSRKQVLQPKLVDLNDVVARMNAMLRRVIGENIELVTIPAQAIDQVIVDPGQVEQVLMNLVVNARDALPDGGRVTLESANVVLDESYAFEHLGVRPGPHVMIAVSDNGTGMDTETQARIFEPFFTTKEKGRGTGLGLSTVFGIVKQSGGSIWVYSEPGRGTTFKVYFPSAPADADIDGESAPAVPPPDLRGTETVLLVEDEERVRVVTRTILRRFGYSVLEASGGGDALLLAERHISRIALMLTDVVMPRMSGRDLAERMRAMRPDLKVLYMSGYTDNVIMQQGELDPGEAFIQKPITPDALARKVRGVLDRPARKRGGS